MIPRYIVRVEVTDMETGELVAGASCACQDIDLGAVSQAAETACRDLRPHGERIESRKPNGHGY